MLVSSQYHTIIGDDFNLVRFQFDISNGVIDHRWSSKFNAWIELYGACWRSSSEAKKFT